MIPFEDQDAIDIAAWLNRASAPHVRAVLLHCETEDDWLHARINGIGASEVGIITGVSTWTSPYALWWRKKLDWRLPRTEGQRWGHLVEDPIASLFAEQVAETTYVAKPVGAPYSLWCHPVSQWMLCTPDRLAVNREDGTVSPVELKSDEGGTGWGEPGTDEVPPHHRAQVTWQTYIFGAPGGWVVRKRGSGKGRLHVYWVPFDPVYLGELKDAAGDFLASVALDQPPEPDGARSTTEALKEINPAVDADAMVDVPAWLFAEWRKARQDKRDAAERESLLSNQLRAAMGRAEYATYRTHDGLDVVFAKRRIGKRQGYSVPPGTTDQLHEVGTHEQRDTPAGVRPGPDGPAGTPPAEERSSDCGPEGAAVGDGPSTAVDQGGAEIADLVAWAAEHSHPGQTCEEYEQSAKVTPVDLPPELARLVERARREDGK